MTVLNLIYCLVGGVFIVLGAACLWGEIPHGARRRAAAGPGDRVPAPGGGGYQARRVLPGCGIYRPRRHPPYGCHQRFVLV